VESSLSCNDSNYTVPKGRSYEAGEPCSPPLLSSNTEHRDLSVPFVIRYAPWFSQRQVKTDVAAEAGQGRSHDKSCSKGFHRKQPSGRVYFEMSFHNFVVPPGVFLASLREACTSKIVSKVRGSAEEKCQVHSGRSNAPASRSIRV
jgi:hypothetical protein